MNSAQDTQNLSSCILSYDDAVLEMNAEGVALADEISLGSADITIARDANNQAHLYILSSAGAAIKIPVAFFDRFR